MSKKLKVALASDHAGFILKNALVEYLENMGYETADLGTDSGDSVDYPDYARKVSTGVSKGEYDRGILICATGIGMSITANRFKNVRAALVVNSFHARMAARHNKANVLVFGAKITSAQEARIMTDIWLKTEFEGGRHSRRISKIEG
jgi:ribose 5-phosphate isomerase B